MLHGNPDSLVFIEGVGAAELLVSERRPMPLKQGGLKNRIVWSVHDYTWTWRWYRLRASMGQIWASRYSLGRGVKEEQHRVGHHSAKRWARVDETCARSRPK